MVFKSRPAIDGSMRPPTFRCGRPGEDRPVCSMPELRQLTPSTLGSNECRLRRAFEPARKTFIGLNRFPDMPGGIWLSRMP
jgi:hypothetical protein